MHEVDTLRAKRWRSGQVEYLVKWRGLPSSQATWEPRALLAGCDAVLQAWRAELQQDTAEQLQRPVRRAAREPREQTAGCRVRVYWAASRHVQAGWYKGRIDAWSPTRGHFVVYDDGDELWADLYHCKWELVDSRGPAPRLPDESGSDSDSESDGAARSARRERGTASSAAAVRSSGKRRPGAEGERRHAREEVSGRHGSRPPAPPPPPPPPPPLLLPLPR